MNSILLAILIIFALICLIILWKILKPYTLKYNTTLFITGELGAGKTLTGVKTAIICIRKNRFKIACYNKIKMPIINKIRSWQNKRREKKNLTLLPYLTKKRRPQLISNIPIHFKSHLFSSEREWSVQLKSEMLVCLEKFPEMSVMLIDELPQLVNQFNWDLQLVQQNINEMITFYRHYYAGNLIITAQSVNDVVVQIRRKCNQAVWCYHMKKYLFGLFYTIRMADMMLNDNIQSMSTTYIEDNTKLHFGLFPKKNTYDTRCYSERINNAYIEEKTYKRWNKLKTNEIIRMEYYESPLDDKTSNASKKRLYDVVQKMRSVKNEERKQQTRP